MSTCHLDLVIKDQQLGLDRTEYLLVVPARQIGPADRVAEECVPRQQLRFLPDEEADATLRVTRRVQYVECPTGKLECVPVPELDIDLNAFGLGHAEPSRLVVQPAEEAEIVFVHVDGRSCAGTQFSSPANVVDVSVGHCDPLDGQSEVEHNRLDAVHVVTWIHDKRFASRLVPNDRAVAPQGADRQNLMDHRWYASNSAMGGFDAFKLGVAWHDLSSRGRLRATGVDRARLIHAISSNAVESLSEGQGTYAFFLNAQGRIQADSFIFVDKDRILIDCEPRAATTLRDHIEDYIIMDDVTLTDIASETALIALAGPDSGDMVASLGLRATEAALTFARSGDVCVFCTPRPGVDYCIMAPSSEKLALIASLRKRGAAEADEQAWESHRVLNWIPRFGIDYQSKNIPHETRQLNAVSFAKGCYTGQEIVERVSSRGQVRRQLVGIELEAANIPADLTVTHKGKPVGALTSPTPALSGCSSKSRGFAIVRSSAASPGTAVRVGAVPAKVRDVSRN